MRLPMYVIKCYQVQKESNSSSWGKQESDETEKPNNSVCWHNPPISLIIAYFIEG